MHGLQPYDPANGVNVYNWILQSFMMVKSTTITQFDFQIMLGFTYMVRYIYKTANTYWSSHNPRQTHEFHYMVSKLVNGVM
jgi:hypothetical protein